MILEIELSDSQLAKIADMVAAKLNGGTLTVGQVAKAFSVSTKTINRRIKAGIIPTLPGISPPRIPAAYVDGMLNPNPGGNGA